MKKSVSRPLFTVMAGHGVGEFLWITTTDSPRGFVGGVMYSLMDARCGMTPDNFSVGLYRDMCCWVERFTDAEPDHVIEEPWFDFDWESFNAEGVRLAKRLRAEMGETAHVQYVRSRKDPAHTVHCILWTSRPTLRLPVPSGP